MFHTSKTAKMIKVILLRAPCQNVSVLLSNTFIIFACITLHLSILNVICQSLDQSVSLCRSCWSIWLSSWLLTTPNSFVSSANFSIELRIPQSKSFINMRKRTGQRTESWGTPLQTGCQHEQTRCQKFSFRSCFGGDKHFPSFVFGERPRQAADVAHLLLLAGSQRRCSVDRAGALKVCLRSVVDWKVWLERLTE